MATVRVARTQSSGKSRIRTIAQLDSPTCQKLGTEATCESINFGRNKVYSNATSPAAQFSVPNNPILLPKVLVLMQLLLQLKAFLLLLQLKEPLLPLQIL